MGHPTYWIADNLGFLICLVDEAASEYGVARPGLHKQYYAHVVRFTGKLLAVDQFRKDLQNGDLKHREQFLE